MAKMLIVTTIMASAPKWPGSTPTRIAEVSRAKANSPPGASSSAASAAGCQSTPKARARAKMIAALTAISPTACTKIGDRIGDDRADVEPRADRNEEEAEQQALERLDRHFDLAPEFGLGEQQAGDEGAEPHREIRRPLPPAPRRPRRAGRRP